MQHMNEFKVAIVGAGMCGLACAIALAREGIDVHIFEATSKFEEIGAGVGLGPNALRALKGLGLLDAVYAKIKEAKSNQRLFCYVPIQGEHNLILDYNKFALEGKHEGVGIYRPVFLEALIPLLDPKIAHFNKRVISVEQLESGGGRLHFADGDTHEADLIIGADGIKSVTRAAVVGEGASRMGFANTHAYRGLVSIEALKAEGFKTNVLRPHNWMGMNQHIITFPIRDNTTLNIVAFNRVVSNTISPELPQPWVESVDQQELIDAYRGCGNDVRLMLKYMKNPSRWSIHTLYPPLPSYVKGSIVLIGDAAHGMLPHMGAGVGQGFEDVYTLSRLLVLSHTNKMNLETALSIYDELRPPRANMVLQRSIDLGNIFDNYGPGGFDAEDIEKRLIGMFEPVWHHDLEAQVSAAIMAKTEAKQNVLLDTTAIIEGDMSESTNSRSKRKHIISHRLQEIIANSDNVRKCSSLSCGAVVEDEDAVLCSSVGCDLAYHLECQGLLQKPLSEWYCDDECKWTAQGKGSGRKRARRGGKV